MFQWVGTGQVDQFHNSRLLITFSAMSKYIHWFGK